ncbi:hypothetical protein EKO27_g7391 [Xylaria grammica]|uniref:Uncharacterized protein n=1 Tax=Xylaria grammica TaxID=363999 RepID=A0A439CZT0_9PEZI|nr:hypothetical protein EKO27_g7391 [Xylaria grammica]
MNRLCRSSYGSLDAVINIPSGSGDSQRVLRHFSRNSMTGEWYARAVISARPESGGSIIQNTSKRHTAQEHGDFEVVVLEKGVLKHYTRYNYPPTDDKSAWKCSATVNDASGPNSPIVAPLLQSRIPIPDKLNKTTLETAILQSNGEVLHYRCPQLGACTKFTEQQHEWHRGARITTEATGPVCLYQTSPDSLMALVPVSNGTQQHRFSSGTWTCVNFFAGMNGPSCIYTNPALKIPTFHALIRVGYRIFAKTINGNELKNTTPNLPSFLSQIRHDPRHRIPCSTNPMAVVSPYIVFGRPSNTDVIVFLALGTSEDTWTVMHYGITPGTKRWIVSGVVLPHVTGMPL